MAAAVVAIWGVAAILIGWFGLLARLPVPPPAIALLLTAVVLLLLRLSPVARQAVRNLGARPLVVFHLTRIVAGAYFLMLYRRGDLPGEFAVAAGWGDIIVGAGALVVAWICLPIRTAGQRRGLLVWNAVGLADIGGVLANGARLLLPNPAMGAPFTVLPLALLPLFVVPIVLVTHVLVFVWYAAGPRPRQS
jgi:hypothetical protein